MKISKKNSITIEKSYSEGLNVECAVSPPFKRENANSQSQQQFSSFLRNSAGITLRRRDFPVSPFGFMKNSLHVTISIALKIVLKMFFFSFYHQTGKGFFLQTAKLYFLKKINTFIMLNYAKW